MRAVLASNAVRVTPSALDVESGGEGEEEDMFLLSDLEMDVEDFKLD